MLPDPDFILKTKLFVIHPNHKKWFIAGIVLTVLVGVSALAFSLSRSEPLYQGRPVSAWAKDLNSPYPEVRSQAGAALRDLGPEAVPILVKSLRTRNWIRELHLKVAPWISIGLRRKLWPHFRSFYAPMDRADAARGLEALGPAAEAAVPVLGKALRDADRSVASQAGVALGRIGPPAVSELIGALSEADPMVRSLACSALGTIGPRAARAVPALVEIFKSTEKDHPQQASHALARIGPGAIPALVAALSHPAPRVRALAASTVGSIGPPAREAVPALLESLHDDQAIVREKVIGALGTIWPVATGVAPALVEALQDPEPAVRLSALQALARTGQASDRCLPRLVELLEDEDFKVRGSSALLLGQLGAKAGDAIPALERKLEDRSEFVSEKAEQALQKIRTPAAR
ncbi:MAG: HEAT repeat domain-containing protein [Chloroflexi bacterium]|nr:HEAT repeat domain-containing protein [Chloroflexota bacterium]